MRHSHLDNNHCTLVSLFLPHCSRCITTCRIIFAVSLGLSMTSHRLLSSTKQKNHKCHCMTSDATLVFSSCPDNTPTLGLHRFGETKGQDLIGVFYIAALQRIIESTLAPYSYPRFCNICGDQGGGQDPDKPCYSKLAGTGESPMSKQGAQNQKASSICF